MADWIGQTQAADQYDTKVSAEQRSSSRSGTRGGALSSGFLGIGAGTLDSGSSYDVVGINATKAREAGNQIVASSKKVMDDINNIQMEAGKLDAAVKGNEIQTELKNYLDKVKLYCQAVVSDLNAFGDKLYEVSKVWEESQASFATNTIAQDSATSFSGDTTNAYQTKEAQG